MITNGPDLKIQLLNPITRVQRDLPSISTFVFENIQNMKVDWFNVVHKASLSKIGTEFLVMVIYGPRYSLAFTKLGETTWTIVKSQFRFTSVVFYKGNILGLSFAGTLVVVEINERKSSSVTRLVSPPVDESGWDHLYLVESCDDLLLVCAYFRKMVVYKFDILSHEWKKMEILGDRALFADEHSCISATSCEGTNLKTDTIYYSQDNLQWFFSGDPNFEGECVNLYDMKRKIHDSILYRRARPFFKYRCPVWLIPSLW